MALPKILIVGGDNTSDRYGAELARHLQRVVPQEALIGVGGPRMEKAGVKLIYDISHLDTFGVLESLRGMHLARKVVQRVSEVMDREKPSVVIQIGMPVFDFRLIKLAQCKEIPVIYYYTPFSSGAHNVKVQEFTGGVVQKVAGVTRHEVGLFQEAGVDAQFVGHPIVDLARPTKSRQAARDHWGISQQAKVISLLPGGREVEVKALLPTMLKGVARAQKQLDTLEVVISLASTVGKDLLRQWEKPLQSLGARLIDDTYDALQMSDLAIVNCGTASLEASLLGIPSLAVYKVSKTNYLRDKRMLRKEFTALPNVLLHKAIIPELVQSNFTESRVAESIIALLQRPNLAQEMGSNVRQLKQELGEPGSLEKTASLILSAMGEGKVS